VFDRHDAAESLKYAEQCRQMAEKATKPEDAATWLRLEDYWLKTARQADLASQLPISDRTK